MYTEWTLCSVGWSPDSLVPFTHSGKSSSYYDSSPEYSDYSDGESSEEEQEDPKDYRPGQSACVIVGAMWPLSTSNADILSVSLVIFVCMIYKCMYVCIIFMYVYMRSW